MINIEKPAWREREERERRAGQLYTLTHVEIGTDVAEVWKSRNSVLIQILKDEDFKGSDM